MGQPGPIQLMLRSLLAERFKLVIHNEDREMPIFALVVNRPDGKLGPQLTKSDVDCAAMMGRGRGDGPGRGGPPPGPPQPGQPMPCGIRIAPGNMVGISIEKPEKRPEAAQPELVPLQGGWRMNRSTSTICSSSATPHLMPLT